MEPEMTPQQIAERKKQITTEIANLVREAMNLHLLVTVEFDPKPEGGLLGMLSETPWSSYAIVYQLPADLKKQQNIYRVTRSDTIGIDKVPLIEPGRLVRVVSTPVSKTRENTTRMWVEVESIDGEPFVNEPFKSAGRYNAYITIHPWLDLEHVPDYDGHIVDWKKSWSK